MLFFRPRFLFEFWNFGFRAKKKKKKKNNGGGKYDKYTQPTHAVLQKKNSGKKKTYLT